MIRLPCIVLYTGRCPDVPQIAVLVSVLDEAAYIVAKDNPHGRIYGVLFKQLIPA